MKRKMEQYQKLLEYAQRSALEYIRGIDQAAVYPDAESLAALARFDESLPETGTDALSVLELLNTIGAKGTTAQIGGGISDLSTAGFCWSLTPPSGSQIHGTRTVLWLSCLLSLQPWRKSVNGGSRNCWGWNKGLR